MACLIGGDNLSRLATTIRDAGRMRDQQWGDVADQAARLETTADFSGILRATRGDEVLYESFHGMANRADGIPVTRSTRFATASLSKMFTAVGVLDAAGRGEVDLQDAVVDVLPPDRRPTTLLPGVTVHHLLSHTSGIADYFEEDEDLPGYRENYDEIWDRLPNYSVRDYAALLPLFADLPPVCPPGTAYHYSNAGYVLLAAPAGGVGDALSRGGHDASVRPSGDDSQRLFRVRRGLPGHRAGISASVAPRRPVADQHLLRPPGRRGRRWRGGVCA